MKRGAHSSCRRAMTLVELLTVVIILIVLIGVGPWRLEPGFARWIANGGNLGFS